MKTTKKPEESPPDCPLCGKGTIPKSGRNGAFWGCSDYPNCKGTVSKKKEELAEVPSEERTVTIGVKMADAVEYARKCGGFTEAFQWLSLAEKAAEIGGSAK